MGAGKDQEGSGWGRLERAWDVLIRRQKGVVKGVKVKCTSSVLSLAIVWKRGRGVPQNALVSTGHL